MDDNIQEEHPSELDPTSDDLIQATCTFTFKTYMFCGNKLSYVIPNGYVSDTVISTDYNGISTEINIQYPENNPELSSVIDGEQFIPQINMMYVGFYPVPSLSHYNKYMEWVNTIPNDVIEIGVDGKNITTSAEYYPYIDLFSWKFDEFGSIEY